MGMSTLTAAMGEYYLEMQRRLNHAATLDDFEVLDGARAKERDLNTLC